MASFNTGEDGYLTVSKTVTFTHNVSIDPQELDDDYKAGALIDIEPIDVEHTVTADATLETEELAYLIHEYMREEGLLFFDDPNNDVPYCATTTAHRNALDRVAAAIGSKLKIELEINEE